MTPPYPLLFCCCCCLLLLVCCCCCFFVFVGFLLLLLLFAVVGLLLLLLLFCFCWLFVVVFAVVGLLLLLFCFCWLFVVVVVGFGFVLLVGCVFSNNLDICSSVEFLNFTVLSTAHGHLRRNHTLKILLHQVETRHQTTSRIHCYNSSICQCANNMFWYVKNHLPFHSLVPNYIP